MNEKEKNNGIEVPWWRDSLLSFMKVSALFAIPIIIALYLGKYLDDKFHTTPWLFLGLTGLSFMISLSYIYISMIKYLKSLGEDTDSITSTKHTDKENKNNQEKPKDNINKE